MGTINKQILMGNKKGDLGHVWMAAHFPHRIRKQIVEQTNIISSVDKILVDQIPVVTYRILGFLLLGVARLYSKKVDYLLVDYNHSLYEMKVYCEGRTKVKINVGGMCTPESSNQKSKTNVGPESSRKKCHSFIDTMRAEFSSISLPENFALDAFDLQVVEDESSSEQHTKSHLEIVLPDTWGNDQTGHASTSTYHMFTNNSEMTPENLRTRFSLEECMDPMELDEPHEEAITPFTEQESQYNNNNSINDHMVFEDKNDSNPKEDCTTEAPIVLESPIVLETTLLDDNITVKPSPSKTPLSVNVNITPRSKGKRKSDNISVRTPAVKERARESRKRTCVYDDTFVIRNAEYKEWVTDASDLLRERRKRLPNLTRRSFNNFMDPIIPINAGFPSNIRDVISKIEVVPTEELGGRMEPNIEFDDGVGSPAMHKTSEENEEEELIAPSTPVTQSTSKANHEGPTSSCESRDKEMFPINDVEFDSVQMKEGPASSSAQNQGLENWSDLTRSVGGYLNANFTPKKDVVKLSQILRKKTKSESARLFSEILLLKTGDYIDVKQEKPYSEIFVMQTLKLKEVFGGERRE